MKISKINLGLIAAFSLLLLFAFTKKNEPITVHVKMVKQSETEFKKGILSIAETREKFEITEIKDFTFSLQKGKYRFKFASETPYRLHSPGKITKKENTITIFLGESKPLTQEYATAENWQQLLKENRLKFIHFGIAPVNPKEFYEKYGISVKNEGCVITPVTSAAAEINNRIVANYLTGKFGNEWKKDLEFLPFGLK